MEYQTLLDHIETQINRSAQHLIDKGDKQDSVSYGKLTAYLAIRRALSKEATLEDIGLLDAFNDTLQHLGLIDSNATFLSSK